MPGLRYILTILVFATIIFIYRNISKKELKYTNVIEINQGKLRGSIEKSAEGNDFFCFKGIPYANAERFSLPKPNNSWDGILEATKLVECVHMTGFDKKVTGVEDCLVLNINTPTLNSDANKAVMVYIYGGGFFEGSPSYDLYGPELFMDKDVVLVTINYRLGPHGFLSDGTETLPGNQGLWDQRTALIWVKNNIRHFGGNPNKVTIFGESAGSSSVMFQLFSPHSGQSKDKLFHGVIAQSGVPSSNFVKTDKHPGYYARTLADVVGCDPKAETDGLINCLKTIDPETLAIKGYLNDHFLFKTYPFKPVIDGLYRGNNGFLPQDPWDMLINGFSSNVPIMMGFNKDEGLIFGVLYLSEEGRFERLKNDWGTVAASGMFYREEDEVNQNEKDIANDYLKNHLKGKVPENRNDLKDVIDMYGDPHFQMISLSYARKLSSNSKVPVYTYSFDHQGSFSVAGALLNPLTHVLMGCLFHSVGLSSWNIFDDRLSGVAHGDDLFAMFKPEILPCDVIQTKEDKYVSNNVVTLWTNFAKTGNPTPKEDKEIDFEWLPMSKSTNFQHLKIDSNSFQMTNNKEYEQRLKVWENIWEKVPPYLHLRRSRTWENPKSYRTSSTENVKRNEL